MCTLVVLHRCFPDAQLLIAANRDEYLDRPAAGPELRAWNGREVISPLDLRAGGTWLGLNGHGLFSALTNRPDPSPDPDRRSRGLLVADALTGNEAAAQAAERLAALPARAYNPFNLLVADGQDAFVAVYQDEVHVTELAPGAHVIGNADPDSREHPKVGRILAAAEKVAVGPSEDALSRLAGIARGHDGGGDNRLADTCIHAGGYGTRCSTLLRRGLDRDEDRLLFADGAPCENEYRDLTPLLGALDRRTGTNPGANERNVA